jgi:enoyl-CoA hydratase
MTSPVTYALTDGIAVITMDDGKANAVSLTLQAGINEALDQAEADNVPVVLTGRPGILSAGFDLKTLAASGQPAVDMLNGGLQLSMRLLSFPTPVVVACPGHSIAMGIFLMLSCDYRIGVRGNYKYSANEVAIGMTMPFSTIEILRHRVTPAALTRAVVLAEAFTPDNAVETGVLDLVVDEADLMSTALATAESFTSLNMDAHKYSKQRLRVEMLEAMRVGLEKDYDGWSKQFLA